MGYVGLDSVDELDETIVDKAQVIPELFSDAEWGGCNQCYLLKDGRIGIIGHRCYKEPTPAVELQVLSLIHI